MRAKRGRLRNAIEYAAARSVLALLERLPLRIAQGLAACLGRLAYYASPAWKRIARRNLELAMGELDRAARERIVRGCYANLGRVVLALARAPRLNSSNIGEWISYEGFEHYRRASERGRGVLFLTAHLGNWELSSTAHALLGHPMDVMVRPLDNPLLDRLVDRRRTMHSNRTIGKQHGVRETLKALGANRAVGVLADQNTAGDDGVFVDFFGLSASATRSVAQLAMRTGAAVIPGFAFWNESERRYVLKFYEPLEMAAGGDREADVRENTARCQKAIERAVRERPEQWLWIHRRWKRRPPGEAPLYSRMRDDILNTSSKPPDQGEREIP